MQDYHEEVSHSTHSVFFSCTCSWKEGAKRQKYKVEGSTHLTSVEPTLGTKPRAYQRLMPPLLLWKTLLLPVCSLLPNSSTPHGFLLFLSATPLAETTTRDLLQVTSLLPLPLSSICHDHMVNLNEEMQFAFLFKYSYICYSCIICELQLLFSDLIEEANVSSCPGEANQERRHKLNVIDCFFGSILSSHYASQATTKKKKSSDPYRNTLFIQL